MSIEKISVFVQKWRTDAILTVIDYVYDLTDFYLQESEVAQTFNSVQAIITRNLKVVPEVWLSPATIKLRADKTPIQLIGLPQELQRSKV